MPKDNNTKTPLERLYPQLDPGRMSNPTSKGLVLAKLRLGSTQREQLVNLYYRDLGLEELLQVLVSEQELR